MASFNGHRFNCTQGLCKFHAGRGAFMTERMVKSTMFQLINGLLYLHANWIIHRDIV